MLNSDKKGNEVSEDCPCKQLRSKSNAIKLRRLCLTGRQIKRNEKIYDNTEVERIVWTEKVLHR